MQCNKRSVHIGISEGGLGSFRGSGVEDLAHAYCLWILTVHSSNSFGLDPSEATHIISLTVEGDMRVDCGQVGGLDLHFETWAVLAQWFMGEKCNQSLVGMELAEQLLSTCTVKPANSTYPWDGRKSSAICRDV
jgi:hypothetical protein